MSTKRNIVANVGGRIWQMLMSFAFVPLYIRLMGIEGYGLVGFFTTMLAVLFVLDLGLSTTVSRELAALGNGADARGAARRLLRSLEVVYWATGIVLSLGILVAAPWIASRWLNVRDLSLGTAVDAVRLMAACLLFRWPVALYSGALMGQRRHVSMNAILAVTALLQGAGAVLMLWLVSPSVVTFFSWQVFVSLFQVVLLAHRGWLGLALAGDRPRASTATLRSVARFSAGVTGIGILSVILTQLDKFVLSRLLPLDLFGYYALASMIAQTLTAPATAIHGAVFPSLSRLAATKDHAGLSSLYHRSCQLMSTILFPAGCALAFFSDKLLAIYLRDPVAVDHTAALVSLFAVGNTLLGTMMLPFALQLASGWTRLSITKNLIAIVLYVPLMLVAVRKLGVIGAPMAWLLLCLGYFIVEIAVMHRRLLLGEQWRWYAQDVGIPALLSILIVGGTRLLLPAGTSPEMSTVCCVAAASLAVLTSTFALPAMRTQARTVFHQRRYAS